MKEKKQAEKVKRKKARDPLSLTVLLIRTLCVCVFRVSAGNDDGSVLHWR